jgi:tetratricopeptide (TPR) repeat protein
MNNLPVVLENLTVQVIQIKWMTMALMVIFIIGLTAIFYLFYSFKKLFKRNPVDTSFRTNAKMLLDMNDLDSVIEMARDRTKQFPGEIFAHWYLGLAYYRKKEWHKALSEFNYIYEVEPSWRHKHLNPFIYDIKEQLKNTRPEIIKK